MKFLALAILISGIAKIANAQSSYTTMGARAAALGHAATATRDEWSLWNNPGAMPSPARPALAFARSVSPRLVGANRIALVAALPIRNGQVAGGVYGFGDAIYGETLLAAGYAHKLGNTSLGVRSHMIQIRAEGFSTYTTLGLAIGGTTTLSQKVTVGACASNINQPKFPDGQLMPVTLNAGLVFDPSHSFRLLLDAEKKISGRVQTKSALEYVIKKKLYVRTGFNLGPMAAFGGLGLWLPGFHMDYSLAHHPRAGSTHQVSVASFFRKKPTK